MSGPRQSPTPDYEEQTPSKTPTRDMPAVKGDLRKSETKQTIGAVIVAVGIIFGAWRVVLSEAKAQTDAGVVPIEKRVTTLEQTSAAVMTEVRELRLDLREAYKAQRYDRPSPRLEKPPPPIALPDGGL